MKRLVLAALLLTACDEDKPPPSDPIQRYEVRKLFDVDGCSVYTFEHGSWTRYFTKCTIPAVVQDTNAYKSGKTQHSETNTSVSVPAQPPPPAPVTFTMKCTVTNGTPSCVQEK